LPSTSPVTLISRLIAAFFGFALLAASAPAYAAEPTPYADPAKALPYIRLPPIFVPVIKGDQVSRQIGVTLTLEHIDNSTRSDVDAKRKQLYDALFRELYGFFQERVPASGHIDQAYLKTRLLKTAIAVVGPNLIKEVLIVQLFERPQ
jgi:hypothetical protein